MNLLKYSSLYMHMHTHSYIHPYPHVPWAFINAYNTVVHTHMLQRETQLRMQHVNDFREQTLLKNKLPERCCFADIL